MTTGGGFGCERLETVHEGARSLVLRGVRALDGTPVVVKTSSERGGAERGRGLQFEWEVLADLRDVAGVVSALGLEREGARLGLVMRDTGGTSLQRLALAGALPLEGFLEVSLALTRAIEQLHRHRIVHKDLHPGNILLGAELRSAQIIDFASATRWMKALTPLGVAAQLGALAYLSPEQTGRMNRAVDHRSDLYSLGVVLFELLTGSVPFGQTDALELVHAHVARRAPDPAELVPGLPQAVRRIILKLLSKNAEDRYQSASGLRDDLERCRDDVLAGRLTIDFGLGASDRPAHFQLPQRLYGREGEGARLAAAFDAASGGAGRLVVVSGQAGVGKTALVRELLPSVTGRRAWFAAGKFEQFERGGAYGAYAQALESLSRQLLAESPERLTENRERITAATLGVAPLLIELCPALALVLGPRPPAPPVPASEARHRLLHALLGLLLGVASTEHPLCLFLDDLHWARPDALTLLKQLALRIGQTPLLVVVAYREEEAAASAALKALIEELVAQGVALDRIGLEPLGLDDSAALVRDTVTSSGDEARSLAETAFARTRGNPYFLKEFLASVHGDRLIRLGKNGWTYDLDRIRQRKVTDNVVELLIARLGQLSEDTRAILKVAACLGNQFDVRTLSAIAGRSAVSDLWTAVAAELVLPLGEVRSLEELDASGGSMLCQFTHDRVQQAIMSLVQGDELREIQLRVGQHLVEEARRGTGRVRLFEAVSHLNHAGEAALSTLGRRSMATLNRDAALESLRQAAGAEALEFSRAGMSALGSAGWTEDYELTRDLHLGATEAAFVAADYEAFSTISEQALRHVRAPLDAARVRSLEGMVHYARFALADATRTYLEALRAIGVVIPEEPSAAEIREELRLTAECLRHKTTGDLLGLPACSDPTQRMAMELLSRIILATGSGLSDLFPVVTCRLVRMSVEHGNIAESVNGYIFYGQLMSRDHDLERAYHFGKLALDIAHRFEDGAMLSQAYLYVGYQLIHWRLTFEELVPTLETALRYGLRAGSPFNAACSATTLCIARFWSGEDLSSLLPVIEQNKELVVRFRQGLVLNWHDIWLQVALNLRGEPADPGTFAGPAYDEAERLPVHREANDPSALFNYYVAKATLACHLGDFETAVACLDENTPLMPFFATQFWAIPVVFLDSLARVALARRDPERAEALIARVQANKEKLESWLRHNRRSIEHKLCLLEAELAAHQGEHQRSLTLFREAVRLAREASVAPEEALACERAARSLLAQGGQSQARDFVRAAHRAYLSWGATTKVKALEREFPNLLPRAIGGSLSLSAFSRDQHGYDPLDLVSALNASRAISSEIRLDRLIPQLMSLLIESAGARLGYLIVERGGQWVVECGQSVERGAVTMLEAVPVANAAAKGLGLATSIVNYVTRTGETVLLDDAKTALEYARDPHVARGEVCSVLCFPLKRSRTTVAIAYLENNLVRGAFTASSLRLLELLSTQAVISLEHAILVSDLSLQVELRTRELSERNAELTAALSHVTEMQQQLVAQEKLAALGALTAGIAHEIKNPLNFVNNFTSVCLGFIDEITERLGTEVGGDAALRADIQPTLSELGRALDRIKEHGGRASAIVTEMASHARATGGRREAVNLNAELARSVQVAFENRRHVGSSLATLSTSYDPNLGLVDLVLQDMHRVFVNIVSNALDAVERKRRQAGPTFSPALTVRSLDRGSLVEVRIRDNGIGIPASSLELIFQPFFTTKPPGEGTGLGLSISHDIVVRGHGGELRAESVPGEFAEFVVVLPRRAKSLR